MRKSTALAAPFFALTVAMAALAAPEFPALTGRVVDAADVLSPSTEAALNRQLEAHERATGQQIVVATVKDLGGLDIQDYGYQLGRHWGIGGKEHDTGVVLVVAPTLRKVRIDVGYGLEGDLTDALSSNIIQTRILPEFRRGDMDAGVRAGVDAIIAVLGGHGEALKQSEQGGAKKVLPVGIFWIIVLIIVLSGGFGGRRGGGGGLARAIVWGSVLNGMSGGRSSGGFGGGGGGFHGGGGSFGGGGASGSW
jgi:uncharacterized protein